MSQWTEQHFVCELSTPTTVPECTIPYTPVTVTVPLTETQQEGKRWYVYNGELYPSISTLISATDREGKASLQEWRRRVGSDAASAITQGAATRGTRWHTFCEYFVTRQPLRWSLFESQDDLRYATHVATVLNAQLRAVVATESRVYSTAYGVAGRLDMAVQLHDGRYAILDFKTGKKQKHGNRLDNYALQGTFYADALTEHWPYGIIETVVIAQLLPDRIVWQETSASCWRTALHQRVSEFAEQVNTTLG